MAIFNVRTIDAEGKTRNEYFDAVDKATLYTDLKNKNVTLISAEEVKKKGGFNINIEFLSRVKFHDKIIFARNLGAMIEAGLSMSRALSVMEKQTKKGKFKTTIGKINQSVSEGKTLSESMKQFPDVFSTLMISMVRAGEESGSLAQSLRVVATQMESAYQLTKKVRGALMYPGVVIGAMVLVGFFMMTYVVPTLSETFKDLGVDMPPTTRAVIFVSDLLKNNIILSLVVMIGAVVGVFFWFRSKSGKRFLDWVSLKTPVIGTITREVNSARTARTLSSLVASGVDILVATRITADVLQNSYYKEVMEMVEKKVEKGEPMASVFSEKENLYPLFVGEMVSVGEETGQLSQMLMGVATFYESEVDQKTKDMSSIIEPLLMIVIGLGVGFFAISMLMPLYSVGDAL